METATKYYSEISSIKTFQNVDHPCIEIDLTEPDYEDTPSNGSFSAEDQKSNKWVAMLKQFSDNLQKKMLPVPHNSNSHSTTMFSEGLTKMLESNLKSGQLYLPNGHNVYSAANELESNLFSYSTDLDHERTTNANDTAALVINGKNTDLLVGQTAADPPMKRKRGRPRKNDPSRNSPLPALPASMTNAFVVENTAPTIRKTRSSVKKSCNSPIPCATPLKESAENGFQLVASSNLGLNKSILSCIVPSTDIEAIPYENNNSISTSKNTDYKTKSHRKVPMKRRAPKSIVRDSYKRNSKSKCKHKGKDLTIKLVASNLPLTTSLMPFKPTSKRSHKKNFDVVPNNQYVLADDFLQNYISSEIQNQYMRCTTGIYSLDATPNLGDIIEHHEVYSSKEDASMKKGMVSTCKSDDTKLRTSLPTVAEDFMLHTGSQQPDKMNETNHLLTPNSDQWSSWNWLPFKDAQTIHYERYCEAFQTLYHQQNQLMESHGADSVGSSKKLLHNGNSQKDENTNCMTTTAPTDYNLAKSIYQTLVQNTCSENPLAECQLPNGFQAKSNKRKIAELTLPNSINTTNSKTDKRQRTEHWLYLNSDLAVLNNEFLTNSSRRKEILDSASLLEQHKYALPCETSTANSSVLVPLTPNCAEEVFAPNSAAEIFAPNSAAEPFAPNSTPTLVSSKSSPALFASNSTSASYASNSAAAPFSPHSDVAPFVSNSAAASSVPNSVTVAANRPLVSTSTAGTSSITLSGKRHSKEVPLHDTVTVDTSKATAALPARPYIDCNEAHIPSSNTLAKNRKRNNCDFVDLLKNEKIFSSSCYGKQSDINNLKLFQSSHTETTGTITNLVVNCDDSAVFSCQSPLACSSTDCGPESHSEAAKLVESASPTGSKDFKVGHLLSNLIPEAAVTGSENNIYLTHENETIDQSIDELRQSFISKLALLRIINSLSAVSDQPTSLDNLFEAGSERAEEETHDTLTSVGHLQTTATKGPVHDEIGKNILNSSAELLTDRPANDNTMQTSDHSAVGERPSISSDLEQLLLPPKRAILKVPNIKEIFKLDSSDDSSTAFNSTRQADDCNSLQKEMKFISSASEKDVQNGNSFLSVENDYLLNDSGSHKATAVKHLPDICGLNAISRTSSACSDDLHEELTGGDELHKQLQQLELSTEERRAVEEVEWGMWMQRLRVADIQVTPRLELPADATAHKDEASSDDIDVILFNVRETITLKKDQSSSDGVEYDIPAADNGNIVELLPESDLLDAACEDSDLLAVLSQRGFSVSPLAEDGSVHTLEEEHSTQELNDISITAIGETSPDNRGRQEELIVSTLGWSEPVAQQPLSSAHMLHWSYCRMTNHLLDPTRESFKCPLCDYKSPRKGHVERHILIHSGEKPYSCSECSYRSHTKDAMALHARVHSGLKKFECDRCSYATNRKVYLERHLALHDENRLYPCSMCVYRATRHRAVQGRGVIKAYEEFGKGPEVDADEQGDSGVPQMGEKPVVDAVGQEDCGVPEDDSDSDGEDFMNRGHFFKHDLDDNEFNQSLLGGGIKEEFDGDDIYLPLSELPPCTCQLNAPKLQEKVPVRKVKIYSDERPYPCPQCSYRATKKSLLDKHIKVHTGERPFPCPLCKYRASRKAHLLRHMRTHAKELE